MISIYKLRPRSIIIIHFLCIAIIFISCSNDNSIGDIFSKSHKSSEEGASRFLSELINKDYGEVEAPVKKTEFRWDFSNNMDVHKYDFNQKVHSQSDMGKHHGGNTSKTGKDMSVGGTLLVKSQGDGTAEFVLKDAEMNMTMDTGSDDGPKTMEQEMPPMVLQGMKENGLGTSCNSSQDLLIKMIFPLPPKDLKVGESVDVPVQIPFRAMGSLLQVTGYTNITLSRYVEIDGLKCAELDVDIDISELKIPSEIKGEYKCSTKGKSLFYFDIKNRRFVSGAIALLMSFNIDAPMPTMSVQGEKSPDAPKRAKMSMANDNFIRVSLIN